MPACPSLLGGVTHKGSAKLSSSRASIAAAAAASTPHGRADPSPLTRPAARAQPPFCSAEPQPASERPCHLGHGQLTTQPGQHLHARPRPKAPGCSHALVGPIHRPDRGAGRESRRRLPTSRHRAPPLVTMATAPSLPPPRGS